MTDDEIQDEFTVAYRECDLSEERINALMLELANHGLLRRSVDHWQLTPKRLRLVRKSFATSA